MSAAAHVSTPAPASPGDRWIEVLSHTHPRYGGLSAAVPELARELGDPRGAGLSIRLAAFCAPGEEVVPSGLDGAQVDFWPASRGTWWKDRTLRKRLAAEVASADGLHLHGLWEASTALAASLARQQGVPYIVSAHGMLEPWALAAKRLKKQVYSALVERPNLCRATCLHALTRAEAEQYLRFGAHSPIAVIPNAVHIPRERIALRRAFLQRFPTLDGKRLVLFLARLHPKKGVSLLLEAWATLAASFPDAHLVIAGPGDSAALEAQAAVAGIGAAVTFTGMLDDTLKWGALFASHVFTLPSYSEGLSVGVLEAMGAGLPVIVTRACNMPEVETHRAGWQIEPNAAELIAALEQGLRSNAETNSSMGANGAELVARRYSWPVVAAQMAAVYSWAEHGGALPETVDFVLP